MIEDRGSIGSDELQSSGPAEETGAKKYQMRGRKPKYESRATEIRHRLIAWKQTPESMRPSLRELEAETGVSHQMLSYYLDGLPTWQAYERAKRLRAEGRHLAAGLIEAMADNIEELRQAAKRGPLNHWQIKTLKLHARHSPEAQELLQKYSHRALKRKRFAEIVKDTSRREGETYIAWARRILDECEKYGTKCPDVITEELLQKLSRP